jgi:surfactin synthase thioesterase subunit
VADGRPGVARRYYLLPYAGGGAGAYRRLTERWPDNVEAVPLGWRPAEYLGTGGIRRLAADLARRVAEDEDRRPAAGYGLFGHSMGALVAYETAAALLALDCPPPAVLVVSGRAAPQYGFRPAVDPDVPQSTAAYLRSCGGDLAAAAEDPEFVDLVRERLRDDVLLGGEHHHPDRPPLPLPLVALGGRDDPLTTPRETAGWLRHSTDPGGLWIYPGGHWFLWDHAPAVADRLTAELHTRTQANPPAGEPHQHG